MSTKLTAKLTAIMVLRVCRDSLSGSMPVRCYDVFHVMKRQLTVSHLLTKSTCPTSQGLTNFRRLQLKFSVCNFSSIPYTSIVHLQTKKNKKLVDGVKCYRACSDVDIQYSNENTIALVKKIHSPPPPAPHTHTHTHIPSRCQLYPSFSDTHTHTRARTCAPPPPPHTHTTHNTHT